MTRPLFALVCLLSLSTSARAAPVRLLDLDGNEVELSAVQRDATILAFWSVSCVPCLEEMPLVEALSRKLATDGRAAVVGVNVDGADAAEKVRKVIADRKVTYRMLRDPNRQLVRKWFPAQPEHLSLPTLIVFDRRLHAIAAQGYRPGETADEFIAEWMPRIEDARAGKLRKHLAFVKEKDDGKPLDPAQMAGLIEKIVRSHHPDLPDDEVKKRVDAAILQMKTTGSFSIQ